jgi:hypothetical protein
LLDEASEPAFQANIEDCQTLIDFFSGKTSGPTSGPLYERSEIAGVPKLEARKVDAAPEGAIVRKKKGEDDDAYFVGKGKKGKKGGNSKVPDAAPDSPGSATTGTQLNMPLPTLSALLSLSIPPPASSLDVPRVIEDLKTKKAWYEANQTRVTAENMKKAEADIRRLTNGAKATNGAGAEATEPAVSTESTDVTTQ